MGGWDICNAERLGILWSVMKGYLSVLAGVSCVAAGVSRMAAGVFYFYCRGKSGDTQDGNGGVR